MWSGTCAGGVIIEVNLVVKVRVSWLFAFNFTWYKMVT